LQLRNSVSTLPKELPTDFAEKGKERTHMNWILNKAMSAALLSVLALSGCAAHAKVITAITTSREQIKFLYVQGSGQGIIKCVIGPAGALSGCHEMAVILGE